MTTKFIVNSLIAVFFSCLLLNRAPAQDMTPWARDPRPYRQRQREKRSDYQEYKRQHNTNLFRQSLSANNNLNNQEKEALIGIFEQYYKGAAILTQNQYTQDLAYFRRITNDSNLAQSEKINKLQEYIKKQGGNDSRKNQSNN